MSMYLHVFVYRATLKICPPYKHFSAFTHTIKAFALRVEFSNDLELFFYCIYITTPIFQKAASIIFSD